MRQNDDKSSFVQLFRSGAIGDNPSFSGSQPLDIPFTRHNDWWLVVKSEHSLKRICWIQTLYLEQDNIFRINPFSIENYECNSKMDSLLPNTSL